jgi:hypothetical protein
MNTCEVGAITLTPQNFGTYATSRHFISKWKEKLIAL